MYALFVCVILPFYIVFNTILFRFYYYFICIGIDTYCISTFSFTTLYTRVHALYRAYLRFSSRPRALVLWTVKRRIRGKIKGRMQYNKHSVALKGFSSSTEALFFKKWDGGGLDDPPRVPSQKFL